MDTLEGFNFDKDCIWWLDVNSLSGIMDSTDVSGIDGNIARSDNLSTVPTCKLSTLDNSDIEVKEVKRTMTTF